MANNTVRSKSKAPTSRAPATPSPVPPDTVPNVEVPPADQLASGTLRVVIDPGLTNPIITVQWFDTGEGKTLQQTANPGSRPSPSVRAMAIALLCAASHRVNPVALATAHALTVQKIGRFKLRFADPLGVELVWLTTLAQAIEDHEESNPAHPLGRLFTRVFAQASPELSETQPWLGHSRVARWVDIRTDPPHGQEIGQAASGFGPAVKIRIAGQHADITDAFELLDLARTLEKDFTGWKPLLSEAGPPSPPPLSSALATYLKKLSDSMSKVRFPGMEATTASGISLLQIYQLLETRPASFGGGSSGTRTSSVLQTIADHPRLVLLGNPGSGKTTALRYLSLALAQFRLGPKPTYSGQGPHLWKWGWTPDHLSRIPVFVELRQLAADSAIKAKPRMEDVDIQFKGQARHQRHEDQIEEWLAVASADWLWRQIQTQVFRHLDLDAPSLPTSAIRECLQDGYLAGNLILLLDGWDEVTQDDHREFLRTAILNASHDAISYSNPMVVTCRDGVWNLPPDTSTSIPWNFIPKSAAHHRGNNAPPWSMNSVHQIEPFSNAAIKAFLNAWFRIYPGLPGHGEARRREMADEVWRRIRLSDGGNLLDLARTPFLLTMIAWLEAVARTSPINSDAREPKATRAGLYRAMSEKLLWEMDDERFGPINRPGHKVLSELVDRAGVERDRFESVISQFAWRTLDSGEGKIAVGELKNKLVRLRSSTTHDNSWATQVVDSLTFRAGLLRLSGPDSREFMHQTLKEFWAARHLLSQLTQGTTSFEQAADNPGKWWEVLSLAAGLVALEFGENQQTVASFSRPWMALAPACMAILLPLFERWLTNNAPSAERPRLAARLISEMASTGLAWPSRWSAMITASRARFIYTMIDPAIPPKDRARVGSILGYLGDVREGVGVDPISRLPKLQWLKINRGPFILGEPSDYPDGNQVPCELPHDFEIAAYPVTVAQYQAFIADGGYADDGAEEDTERLERWWGESGLEWKRDHQIDGPEPYADTFQVPNHPQVGVSWYEALAFCRWFTEKSYADRSLDKRLKITLPSEAQWERAARHTDGRVYPWPGGQTTDSIETLGEYCNCQGSRIGTTSAVGIFPKGKAECEAHDMAGNVREWTRSLWGKGWDPSAFAYPYDFSREREDLNAGAGIRRVLRGGSWDDDYPEFFRCSYRDDFRTPGYRGFYIGFRCVRVVLGVGPG